MNDFQNTNYLKMDSKPHGVFLLNMNKRRKRTKFYYVRVYMDSRPNLPTTIAKCKTKEEAEEIYRKHMGNVEEVPYYEITNIKKK